MILFKKAWKSRREQDYSSAGSSGAWAIVIAMILTMTLMWIVFCSYWRQNFAYSSYCARCGRMHQCSE